MVSNAEVGNFWLADAHVNFNWPARENNQDSYLVNRQLSLVSECFEYLTSLTAILPAKQILEIYVPFGPVFN